MRGKAPPIKGPGAEAPAGRAMAPVASRRARAPRGTRPVAGSTGVPMYGIPGGVMDPISAYAQGILALAYRNDADVAADLRQEHVGSMASRISASTSATVLPVATQPGRSGT